MSSQQHPVAQPPKLNLGNIQGDVILGLPKKLEKFIFYQIIDVAAFRSALAKLVPTITTTQQVLDDRARIAKSKAESRAYGRTPPLLELSGTNIAFSHSGLDRLGLSAQALQDPPFEGGQKKDAPTLADPFDPANNDPKWIPQFKEVIDLIILITGESLRSIQARQAEINKIFGLGSEKPFLKEVLHIIGNVRPGKEKGHEHFGYLDGISQPGIQGFTDPLLPGQVAVPAGIALMKNFGDALADKRPDWATDGSFLVFRYLEQLVPEFDAFVASHPVPDVPPEIATDLTGARMVGRWKSGAPIDVTPLNDQPALGADPQRNNNFDFSTDKTQDRCPFAAHIRKTNPRSDLPSPILRRIWRAGIPFGDEVTEAERQSSKTSHSRGLAFVCYQSSIVAGFRFLQRSWCNNEKFPPKGNFVSGHDPIIGQNGNDPRDTFDSKAVNNDLQLPVDWVVPKGGEYFFSPSIQALEKTFAV